MNIRLLVLDIDGTIAPRSNQVSVRVLDCLKRVQSQGIRVGIATGRMYHSALPFHRAINSDLPLIAYNGAWIKNPFTGVLEREFALPTAIALEILDHFESPQFRDHLEVHCYFEDQLFVREITEETRRYVARSGVKPHIIGDLRPMIKQSTIKLLAISQETELLQVLMGHLRDRFSPDQVYLTQSTEIYFEVTHPLANKGLATQYLTETMLDLKPEQVMAIGDNFNDLELLSYAGFGIAMGDAPDALKAIADWVTADAEEDGVAIALEKFLL
ncbi:MAG: Cof-type HAD-IIB family hydrolase [Microcystaceae cyanobacterium]